MKYFSSDQIRNYLRFIDEKLSAPLHLLIIGGSAAGLAYGITGHTRDIDTFQTEDIHIIDEICKNIHRERGIYIPVSEVAVADAPWHYEERLVDITPADFRYLNIMVPEKHDLILMKVLRGDAHDFQHIREIAQKHPIEYHTLLERFINEMNHVMGNPEIIRISFLYLIEQLFGSEKVREAETVIKKNQF